MRKRGETGPWTRRVVPTSLDRLVRLDSGKKLVTDG